MQNKETNENYIYEEIETYDLTNLKKEEQKLLESSKICFSYLLSEMQYGLSKITLCLPDILIEKTTTKENIYDFISEKEKTKTTINKKYYFPVKTKKEFLNRLKLQGENNYVVKGSYSYNNIEKATISSYKNPIDNIKNLHTMEITIYTKEKFKECFINELKELQKIYNDTLNNYLEGTLNITIDIEELYNNELNRLLDYYEEVENKEEILQELGITQKHKTLVKY